MPPKRRKKKTNPWIVFAAVGGALLLAGIIVTVVLLTLPDDGGAPQTDSRPGVGGQPQVADDLNAIIAELDKKDPGWRLEQWLKKPAPEKNAAAQVLAASRHLPQVWPPQPVRDVKLDLA